MKVKSPLTKTEVKQSQYAFRDELSLFEKAGQRIFLVGNLSFKRIA